MVYMVVGQWGGSQALITALPRLAWLGKVYTVVGQWGEARWQVPNCQVWLGCVMFALWLARGAERVAITEVPGLAWLGNVYIVVA